LNPATATELRQPWAASRRQAQELEILEKPLLSSHRPTIDEPLPLSGGSAGALPRTLALFRCWRCQRAAIMPGNKLNSGQ